MRSDLLWGLHRTGLEEIGPLIMPADRVENPLFFAQSENMWEI
jgi:hypothetical protein